jgi:hypothetical protein
LSAGEIAAGKGAEVLQLAMPEPKVLPVLVVRLLTIWPKTPVCSSPVQVSAGNMLMGQQQPKFQPQMTEAARNMQAQGQQLASYLASGNLPPGCRHD